MTESRLFLSSCTRRELARRRPGRGGLLGLVRVWMASAPTATVVAFAVLLVLATLTFAVARGVLL